MLHYLTKNLKKTDEQMKKTSYAEDTVLYLNIKGILT